MKNSNFSDDGRKVMEGTLLKSCLGVLGGLLSIGAAGWYMSYSTAQASLGNAGSFVADFPLYVGSSLRRSLDPLRLHLKAGLSLLNTRAVHVATWDRSYQIRKHITPFLQNFFGDTTCCYGVAMSMGFDKADAAAYVSCQCFLDAQQEKTGATIAWSARGSWRVVGCGAPEISARVLAPFGYVL